MKNDKEKTPAQSNKESTQVIYDLLKYVEKTPKKFVDDDVLIKALKSQGGIAKLEGNWPINNDEVISKSGISLNTLKKYAETLFNFGFNEIDNLRLKALENIEHEKSKKQKPGRRTVQGLGLQVNELEDLLEKHRKTNFILLQALSSAITSLESVGGTKESKLREKRAQNGIEKLRAIVSLNMPPFDDLAATNVVSLAEYKDDSE